jgi:hypothetical protein
LRSSYSSRRTRKRAPRRKICGAERYDERDAQANEAAFVAVLGDRRRADRKQRSGLLPRKAVQKYDDRLRKLMPSFIVDK